MEKEILKFKKLTDDAVIPSYAHIGDCGLDVTATSIEYDKENDMYICHTGLACEMPVGYAILCLPRSSNTKTELYMPNAPGLVDPATYRGEIQFRYKIRTSALVKSKLAGINIGLMSKFMFSLKKSIKDCIDDSTKDFLEKYNFLDDFPFKPGDRVGQFLIIKTEQVDINEVNELSETSRGTGGFGSTGK